MLLGTEKLSWDGFGLFIVAFAKAIHSLPH